MDLILHYSKLIAVNHFEPQSFYVRVEIKSLKVMVTINHHHIIIRFHLLVDMSLTGWGKPLSLGESVSSVWMGTSFLVPLVVYFFETLIYQRLESMQQFKQTCNQHPGTEQL
jgi:hypothetical protein